MVRITAFTHEIGRTTYIVVYNDFEATAILVLQPEPESLINGTRVLKTYNQRLKLKEVITIIKELHWQAKQHISP